MPSEQKQFFCDEKPTTLEKGYDVEDIIVIDAVESEEPRILEDNSLYELKNVKIDLPKISISDETPLTHEVDTYKQVFESKPQTARKSVGKEKINESPLNCLEECNMLQRPNIRFEEEGMKMSAKILNFSCTKCRDNVRYSPNDLQKHFQLLHCGELPLYPCEMCSFSANDFQSFKQHRLIHRSTLVKCDICNDENVYTLLDLTKHFAVKHCVNGNFQCEKCKFSTKDVGTFVQHIHRHNEIHYKCSKCNHISFTKGEFQQHLFVHSTTFPFSCQYCNYSAAEKDQLVKHVVALHKDQLYAKDKLEKEKCEKRIVKTTAGLKLILRRYKIGTSRKTLWRQKKENNGNDSYVEKNTEVLKNINKIQFKSEEQSNIQEHLNEEKNDTIHIEKPSQKQDESESETRNLLPTSQSSRSEEGSSSGFGFLKNVIHGPAVLMLKNNKISVPANYSAKFMGFKMVDGKQHIVIKLLPTNKSNSCSPGLQPGTIKDNTTDVQHRTAETTGLPTGATLHTSELNNTICTNTSNPLSFSTPLFSGNGTSEKEKTVLAQTRSKSQTVGAEKSTPLLSTNSELTAAPLNLTTKIRISNNVGAWGSCVIQSHPQVLCATVKNPVNVESVEVNSVEPKAQHSGILNNSSINDLNYMPFSGQGSLPFHNYSKMDYLDNSCSISAIAHENSEESSSSKTAVHQYSSRSESGLSSVGMSPNPDLHETSPSKICETYCPLNTKDTCEPLKNQCEDTEILETIQNIDTQNPQADINQGLEDVAEKSDWENISCVDSFTMPKITSVFSLQSTQASDFWSPEETQLLQNVLDEKLSLGKDSDITPNKGVQLHDEPLLKNEGKSNITEYLKGSESPCTLPISSSNVGISVHTKDLNANNCTANTEMGCGKEKQVLSTSNDLGDSEKIPRIAVVDSVKTQSDTRITQQLVKDKIQATPDSSNGLGSFHVLSPPINSEPKKAIFVQSSPKGFILPLHLASKSGLKLVSGRSLSSTNPPGILMTKGIPSSLLLNKKPGMILRLSNGVLGSVTNITGENSQVLGGAIAKEDDKTPSVRADLKKDSPTNIICSSTFDSRPDMAVSSENSIPFKGSYIFRNPAESSVNENSSQNTVPGCQSTKSQSLGSVRQPSEAQQKQSLYALLPDGRQAVLLRCVTPSKSQVGPSDLLQNSTYDHQNHQPKKSGATQQKILLKIIKNPAFDNSQSAKSPKSSLQLDIIQSHQTSTAEEKQLVSSSDALLLTNRLMPANATVTTSTAICNIPPQGTVCTTTHPETQLLRCQTNSSFRSGFNHGKSTRRQISKMKAHVQHKASESMITYENRNFGPKCRDNFQEWPRKKVMLHRKSKRKTKSEDFHDTFDLYRPRFPKDTVRTLRLFPFSSTQLIKCPRRNQPVVVLNHPDTDSPEVVNVMKTIAKFKGQVVKVSLSKRTIQALLEPAYCNISKAVTDYFSAKRHKVLKPVKERFVLKLTLKKTSKNNYQIVKTTSDNTLKAKFNCWYCGRVFDNQDAWVGHGQRHLMEATRDWHMLE